MKNLNQRSMRLTATAYHRNGVAGHGFHAIAFRYLVGGGWHNMIATVFDSAEEKFAGAVHDANGMCTVMDADMAAQGIVTSGVNSWRGDDFEPQLRQWVAQYQLALAISNREAARSNEARQAVQGPEDPTA